MILNARTVICTIVASVVLPLEHRNGTRRLDNELSLVDGQNRTLTVQQWDTFLNGVFPLDRNRLTREWFHSGRAVYHVSGPEAQSFSGTLELGYQIGFPWSLGVGINFSYTTPNVLLDDVSPRTPPSKSSLQTCFPVYPSPPTWATARASRKWPPSPSTSPVPTARLRCPTLTGPSLGRPAGGCCCAHSPG